RPPVRRARGEERGLVGEVPVDGRAADARVLRDRADRGPCRTDLLVQGDRALGDAQARLLLELGSPRHPVGALSIRHWCRANIDRSAAAIVVFRATLLSYERSTVMQATAAGTKLVGPDD